MGDATIMACVIALDAVLLVSCFVSVYFSCAGRDVADELLEYDYDSESIHDDE